MADASLERARLDPAAPLTALKGVGPKLEAVLKAQGLATLRDLLFWFPRRHLEVEEIAAPHPDAVGRLVRIGGRAVRTSLQWLPGRRSLVAVTFAARDGTPFTAPFFNQPYLKNAWPQGTERVLEGTLELRGSRFLLKQPRVSTPERAASGPVLVRYPELEGVSEARLAAWIREVLRRADLERLREEPMPPGLREAIAAWPEALPDALRAMHEPASAAEHERARRRFAVQEAVRLFRRIETARRGRLARRGPVLRCDERLHARIAARIPLRLTDDQARAIEALTRGLAGPAPLGVLLQGDVGTGKTVVALWAALVALASRWQVAFLAPTELLAEQHAEVARHWLRGSAVKVSLLTADADDRVLVRQSLAAGEPQLVYGTHALFAQGTRFARLGLVIVDEQHRFGVAQRHELIKKGTNPHVLVMTATPIPRTLALAWLGDLDCIELTQKPPGRRPVTTLHVAPRQWPRVVRAIARQVARGRRAYVVCPRIGAADEKGGAQLVHARLTKHFACGLVHGELAAKVRARELAAFRSGAKPVLVGTTVLEVGVDVPEATLMVITGVERFGLSTLHQLRGRIGRGGRRGLCLLVGEKNARVVAVCATSDGFALAEEDLRLRGAGELLGTRQSGAYDLRALDPVEDRELLARVRVAVREEPAWARA